MKTKIIDRLIFIFFGISLAIFLSSAILSITVYFNESHTPQTKTLGTTGQNNNKNQSDSPNIPEKNRTGVRSSTCKPQKELIHIEYQNALRLTMSIDPNDIVLTFDDGPNLYHTKLILDTLKQYQAKATFFVVGEKIDSQSCPLLKRMKTEGHEVANHSHKHSYLTLLSQAEQIQEIEDANNAIQQCLPSYPVKWFRPPFGRSDHNTFQVLETAQLNSALWTIDTEDWRKSENSGTILNSLMSSRGQDIILMHDGIIEMPSKPEKVPPEIRDRLTSLASQFSRDRQATVDALAKFLEENKKQGDPYRFVTLSEAFNLLD